MSDGNGTNGHGKLDLGAERETRPDKPCCKRITHEGVCKFETSITWCTEPEGHAGQCSGPLPTIINNTRLR